MCIGLMADRGLVYFDGLRIASILMLDYIYFDLFRIRYINHVFYRKLIKMLSKYFTTDTRKIIDVMEAMEYKPVENRFANMSKKYICYMQIVQTSLWT